MRRLLAFMSIWILSMGLAFSNGNHVATNQTGTDPTSQPTQQATPRVSSVVTETPPSQQPDPTPEPTGSPEPSGTTETLPTPEESNPTVVEPDPTPEQASSAPEPGELEVGNVERLSILTGPESPSRTDEHWNIAGTDLGFTFEHDGTLYMVFGDTWGRDGVEGADWRSNVMVIVEPHDEYGYVITDAISDEHGEAAEILHSLKAPRREYTVIPNGGIAVGDRMYLHYVSVGNWKKHSWGYKEPIVNHSGIAWSDDGGHTWTKDEHAIWEGDSPFAHAAMVEHEGDLYLFGTPASRFGPAQLLRVASDSLLDPARYEYWDGTDWNADPDSAVDVVPGPVGEMSVRWSEHHQLWIMMYKNETTHEVVLRTAENIEGPWEEERTVAAAGEFKSLYAPMLLPIEGETIQFAMSVFLPEYQVYLMEFTLN